MILKSIIVSILLLGSYSIFLSHHKFYRQQSQHQWQDNVVKGQEYIYSAHKEDLKVIAGSSLSARLVMDSMPPEFCNLSFGGQSMFDGLSIVLNSSPKPKQVYIEMNMIKKEGNPAFVNTLFTPVFYYIREELFFMQEKNQPITFIGNYLIPGAATHAIDPFSNLFLNPFLDEFKGNRVSAIGTQNGFENKLIEQEKKEFSIPFKDDVIRKKFRYLKEAITHLTEDKVQVIFFEMPMHPALESSVEMIYERKLFHEYFPSNSYHYLPKPDYADFTTTDGIHMAGESALKFTKYFIQSAGNF